MALLTLAFLGSTFQASPPDYGVLGLRFLRGHLDLGLPLYDSAPFGGRYYLPLGPFPALLMLPAAAARSPFVQQTLLSLPLACVTAVALWRALGAFGVKADARRWLVILAIAGTDYASVLVLNSSYALAHITAVALLSLALMLAAEGRLPLLAGLLTGLAVASRSSSLPVLIPVALLYARSDEHLRVGRRSAYPALGAAPVLALLIAYNAVRFHSPFESGYTYQVLANPALQELRRQGLFSIVHVPENLYYFMIAPPVSGGTFQPSPWGVGLIWISPWLLAGLAARGVDAAILGAGAVLTLLPSFLYYGIGWEQFGYRYALDALPLLLLLAAIGYERLRWQRWLPVLAVVFVPINLAGALWLELLIRG